MTNEATTPIASVELARRLRDAGLEWHPQEGDRFHIPDRGFGDQVWSISEMVIEPRNNILGERELAFNGTVEWALDSIVKRDVVWVPTEGQLRELIGEEFIALYRDDDGSHACVVRLDGTPTTFRGPTAPDAYGKALLATLVG
jgi:hypothetical protein